MKKTGFIGLPVLLAIIAVFVVAAGITGYYLTQRNAPPQVVPTDNSQAPNEQASTTPAQADTSSVHNTNPTISITNISGLTVAVTYADLVYTPDGASLPASLWIQNEGLGKPSLKVALKSSSSGTAAFTLPSNAMEGNYTIIPVGQNGEGFVPLNASPSTHPALAEFNFSNGSISTSIVAVPGMSKYTDSDFGFSFWYPSGWIVTNISETGRGMFAGTTDKAGNLSAGRIIVKSGGMEINIDKVIASDMTYRVNAGACGYCGPVNYFFDSAMRAWMKVYPDGPNGAPDATPEMVAAYKVPKPADVSHNTMGGLHIFPTEQKENASIIPLSSTHFVQVGEYSGQNPGSGIHLPLVNTIVATDPSVAVPVSAAEQIKVIQTEKDAYWQWTPGLNKGANNPG